jgi:YVTN family beta-propeller protein
MPALLRRSLMGFSLLMAPCLFLLHAGDVPKTQPIHPYRPIALALAQRENLLLVANRDRGSITIVDPHRQKIVSERSVGKKLSSLAIVANRILATDEAANELVQFELRDGELRETRRIKTAISPVSVRVSDDGKRATVACLWPRQIQVFDLGGEQPSSVLIDLPFAPRQQLAIAGTSKLIVADAFAGKLAVVDLVRNEIDSARTLAAHNLRGLALDGKHLLVTHQTLYSQGRANAGDIRSGSLIENSLRRLVLANLLNPQADLLRDEQLYSLGDVEQGAGDPAETAAVGDGQIAVAVSGVDELHLGKPEQALWTRIPVGRRPTALAVDAARHRIYVANTFGDSISIVDAKGAKVIGQISLGSPQALNSVQRGESLFHDARLSFEGWFSCQSCHGDGHTNGQLNDNLTDGTFGTPKRVLSLLGVKDTGPWAWNGKMPDLESQIRHSIRSTMQGKKPTDAQVNDLAAYLRSLPPPPSLLKSRGKLDAAMSERGRAVFVREKCADCHAAPTYTTPRTYDVGLRDEVGGSHFNPPSLRGVSQGMAYFHDNRARTLEEVFTRFAHPRGDKLSENDTRDLLHFLGGL